MGNMVYVYIYIYMYIYIYIYLSLLWVMQDLYHQRIKDTFLEPRSLQTEVASRTWLRVMGLRFRV